MIVSIFLEVPLLLAVDRLPRAKTASAALFGMAAASLVGAFAIDAWMIAVALAMYSLASGLSCGIAQAALVDGDPDRREERMAEWTLAGELGDLAAPALLVIASVAGHGWRTAMIVAGGIAALSALSIGRLELPRADEELEEGAEGAEGAEGEEAERPRLRDALANRPLLLWLFACSLCGFLDEALVAFAALFVRDRLGGDLSVQSAVIAACTIGGALGLIAMPRALKRMQPLALLAICAAGSALSYGAWLMVRSIAGSIALMFVVGFFTSAHYPLVKAQAYRSLPERSALVNAVNALFNPIDLLIPLALGLTADRFGLIAALAVLALQPVLLFAIALGRLSGTRGDRSRAQRR
jgi:FSR family fosmidomycin resistance protein-like MFS transporter